MYEVWKTKTVQTNERRIDEVSVFKRGTTWWYKFFFAGRLIRESAKTRSKTVARDAEAMSQASDQAHQIGMAQF